MTMSRFQKSIAFLRQPKAVVGMIMLNYLFHVIIFSYLEMLELVVPREAINSIDLSISRLASRLFYDFFYGMPADILNQIVEAYFSQSIILALFFGYFGLFFPAITYIFLHKSRYLYFYITYIILNYCELILIFSAFYYKCVLVIPKCYLPISEVGGPPYGFIMTTIGAILFSFISLLWLAYAIIRRGFTFVSAQSNKNEVSDVR